MYYSRHLSCFNFGIHVSNTGDGIMWLWHEGISGRRGNQMASCLHAINSGTLDSNKRKLTVLSDCGGGATEKPGACFPLHDAYKLGSL